MAPSGKHCLHAYLPATEPYALWKGVDRKRLVVVSVGCIRGADARLCTPRQCAWLMNRT